MNYVSRGLSEAFLAGPWELEGLVDRAGRSLGRRPRWLRPLARRVVEAFASRRRPRRAELSELLEHDELLLSIVFGSDADESPIIFGSTSAPQLMTPTLGAPTTWDVPSLTSEGELAAWLGINPGELDWFADCRRLERLAPT